MATQNTAKLEEVYKESKQSQKEAMQLPKETDVREPYMVSHSLMAIHRLIEMGKIKM